MRPYGNGHKDSSPGKCGQPPKGKGRKKARQDAKREIEERLDDDDLLRAN
jgi:hypothetical protein